MKKSWNETGNETKQEFFYRLKDSMEDTLTTREDRISENGELIVTDEELTPCLNSIMVMDWIEAIGGSPLVEHVYRSYAKDLETNTLGSLQTRISKNLEALLVEMQEFEQAKVNRVAVHKTRHSNLPSVRTNPSAFSRLSQSTLGHNQNNSRGISSTRQCKICKSSNHFISTCPRLTEADRCAIAKYRVVKAEDIDSDPENSEVVTLDDDYEVNDQD